MDFAVPLPPPEQSNVTSLILSATVHLLLIGALFFGVQWKSKAPTAVEVEIWRSVPISEQVFKPEPLPEPKPEPKAEPTPQKKPDIAIKDEKKPKDEPKKPEPKLEQPDWKKEIAREQRQLDRQKNVQTQLKADQFASARARGLADYASKVRGKIRGNIVLPPGIQGNPEAVFEVTQLPSGEVLSPVKLRKSSGNLALDAAIERAILKSSPLPKPDQPELFQSIRVLELKYRPLDD